VGRPPVNRLSVEAIVVEAVALVDAGEPLSMRTLAKRLDVAAPSLYYHVGSRAELINHIRDWLIASQPLPEAPADDWVAELKLLVQAQRRAYAAHPRLVALLVDTPITSDAVLAFYGRMTRALTRAGFDDRSVAVILEILDSFALGSGLEQAAPTEVWRLDRAAPELTRAARSWNSDQRRLDTAFEIGLEILLQGIAARSATGIFTAPAQS
jgi:AcrR family transcriptional regulator